MGVYPVTRVKPISLKILPSHQGNPVIVCQNNLSGNSIISEFGGNAKVVAMNLFLKNLSATAWIYSINETPLAEFLPEDTDSMRNLKVIDSEWKSERKQLNLLSSVQPNIWEPVGAISVLNPYGYPYRQYALMDLLTNNLAYEMGLGSSLAVQMVNVNYGFLQGQDFISIFGSYVEEYLVYLIETTIIGGTETVPSTFDAAAIISGTIDPARLGIGSNVQGWDALLDAVATLDPNLDDNKVLYFTDGNIVAKKLNASDIEDLSTGGVTLTINNQKPNRAPTVAGEIYIYNPTGGASRKIVYIS